MAVATAAPLAARTTAVTTAAAGSAATGFAAGGLGTACLGAAAVGGAAGEVAAEAAAGVVVLPATLATPPPPVGVRVGSSRGVLVAFALSTIPTPPELRESTVLSFAAHSDASRPFSFGKFRACEEGWFGFRAVKGFAMRLVVVWGRCAKAEGWLRRESGRVEG